MASEVSGGEHVPTAMADAHGGVTRSHVTAAVEINLAVALATRTYGDDEPKEMKVGGAVVMAGHGRARAW